MAKFPGGYEKLIEFIFQHQEVTIPKSVEGRVYVMFIIDEEGNVIEPSIIKAIDTCPECSRTVLNIFSKMPAWIPAERDGVPIKSKMVFSVKF